MNVNRRTGLAMLAVALLLTGCASAAGSTSKAGPIEEPVTLRVATNDKADEPAAPMIAAFAAKVKELSGGSVVIEPAFAAVSAGPDYDQRTARLVTAGTMEMGLIPSRTWDTEGITSLRALNAPFLITSDALTAKVVQDEKVSQELMSGLPKAGVTGLALFPESMRHPFSFGAPFTSVDSFALKKVRTPTSNTVRDVYAALGASANGGAINPQSQDGFEIAYVQAPPATATGNVTFFPKVNVLVVNSKVLAALSPDQRDVLQRAAAMARDEVLSHQRPDAELAAEYCKNGGAVVLATANQLTQFLKAVKPVYDSLTKDQNTREIIDAIRSMTDESTRAPFVRTCGTPVDRRSALVPATPADAVDPSVLSGVYRFELTDQDFVTVNWSDEKLNNHGVYTYTLKDDSSFCWEQKADNVSDKGCGTFVVTPDLVTFTYKDHDIAGQHESFHWSKAPNGDLTMQLRERIDPVSDAVALHPWARIADAG